MVQDQDSVYTEYPDPSRDEWETKLLPALKSIPLRQAEELTGFPRTTLKDWRAGRSRPHPKNLQLLKQLLGKLAK
jgi:hypothetical protein